ncbi:DUF6684 family protein [Halobellus ruber]|uniref:Cox cluster protein n=1 Tax=Halobellus ruber TaxID=2761102 RepID=A0A7J9SIZ9_9EURY|nr:DUF6684 family protein [Halobellus ruber]MBB6645996.1 hypothetical protein [Halobellus ruber]
MSRETDVNDGDDATSAASKPDGRREFDRELLSDLSVNLVPIGIIAVFTLLFVVLRPAGDVSDSVIVFHAALVGGVVLVSVVAGWAITRKRSPLEGSAARSYDTESDRD